MKYVKMLGLLAVAAAAMMAFAGVASATYLTSPAGTTYTSTIKATSEGTTQLDGAVVIACGHSEVEGKIESHGPSVTAAGKISKLTFSQCGEDVVTVLAPGSLEIHTDPSDPTSSGILTSTGATIQIHTRLGIICEYTTNNTSIGTVTGSKHQISTGKPQTATLDISGFIPRTGGSFFCGSGGDWTGSYSVTTPDYLDIH